MINLEVIEFAKYDLAQLSAFLHEADVEKQTQAIEEAIHINSLLAFSAVRALKDGQDRYFVAERLHNFGSIAIEPLETLLKESNEAAVKTLASLVLLRLGSKAGVSVLLDAVLTEPVDRYASLIVEALAVSGIKKAGSAFITRLRQINSAESDLGKSFESNPNKDFVVSVLHALNTLSLALPEDLEFQLTSSDMPIEIKSVLSDKFAIAHALKQESDSSRKD